ncbi:keratin, type I cytoskeletal 19-like [Spea bombifrons]|uniref:keratin, type I cytoskeletal 19-like n=1 Tax=Spea bombifrons TaxID=233779 RepID=UPI00234B0CFF|nr:keratin, type I cytoskeletal 19-like [Spea bombifrons]
MNQGQYKQYHSSSGLFKASSYGNGHPTKVSSHISPVHHGSSHSMYHGGFHKHHHGSTSPHGGSGKPSVYSKMSTFGHGYDYGNVQGGHSYDNLNFGGHNGRKNDGLFSVNEKETMQLLNERLASYLEKVRSLEQENANLESKICEWHGNQSHAVLPDFQNYFKIIEELQSKISAANVENARIVLQIDNASLAADDFKNKFEMEQRLRNNVEADINGLRRVLDGLNIEACDLQAELENLQNELQQMKKTHEEEVNCLRTQLGARINVQVEAAPSVDLNRVLSEVREQYEKLMEKNLREVESLFLSRSEELNRQMSSGPEQLQTVQTDVIDLKRCIQTLEIELQSQLRMKSALERTLADTEASFRSQLEQLQCMIDNVEEQLTQIRLDLEYQFHEYKILMDHKTHLEMEIATYKSLMESQDFHVPDSKLKVLKEVSVSTLRHHVSSHHEPELGKAVSSQEQEK